ncbi:hypothetical protein PVAP13_9KG210785 [Panicum virgatum]|uniref:Uncharacterized protein n=1 Tax=Panicum virgatum TaxID=38727 RepID=A0A8T0NIU7_PANVG|nr:hypothetical protein PVAP13_9KG210785 [Panicum virgatum]
MVLASSVNSRREKRQRKWLVRLDDLRMEGARWCLFCDGSSTKNRGARGREDRGGGLLLKKRRSMGEGSWRAVEEAWPEERRGRVGEWSWIWSKGLFKGSTEHKGVKWTISHPFNVRENTIHATTTP